MRKQFYSGTLASFGSLANGKFVEPDTCVLQGDNGSWTTIAADQYYLSALSGQISRREFDDSGNEVDWSAYTSFRATYTVYVSSTRTATTYTDEAQTFAYELGTGGDPIIRDGMALRGDMQYVDDKNLAAQYAYALGSAVKQLVVRQVQWYENAFTFTLDAGASTVAVTFPTAFAGGTTPVVICTVPYQTSFWVDTITNTGFNFNVGTTGAYAQTINCMAMVTI